MLWVQLAIARPSLLKYSKRYTSLSNWVSHPLLGNCGLIKPPMHVKTTVKTSKYIVILGQTRPWPDVKPEKFCPYSFTPSVLVAFKFYGRQTASGCPERTFLTVSHPRASAWEYDLVRELDWQVLMQSRNSVAGCDQLNQRRADRRTIWSTQRTAPARREVGQSIHWPELPRRRS